ncbi:response regulator [Ferrovibrio sp.]|uniref:response regulator n=1 Tax=Ferrovibrio sp. TaxID=1917215 RepID=UPI001B69568A|nr:response regulator [Ferrovibrio sp.]MBP7065928.1 response regulator [Ferrovibrio sp.]
MARILVAEDEVAVREFIRRVLELRGHEIVTVGDGAEALVKLNRLRFDLLLTDIGMPNMDGLELALKVARDHPALPVLMMSGYAVERRRAADLADLARGLLQKPFSMVDLAAAVEKVLAEPVAG